MDESQTYSPFRSVLLREWRRMTSRRLYFGVCIVLPLFTLFFMATIFGNGQMENIPIGIVDQDNTATSRTIVRNISAVPTFKVTKHFVNEAAARESVQKKEIYGYLSIPPQFEQNAITGKNATLSYYYHYALMSVGGELMAAFERFRQQNVTDLILDLRYNNGGDVLSSAVLGTLVAGNDYKGQVYAHTTFNEDRTEAGEGGDYKIGVKETVERIYEPLETALQHAVGLKKIYVLVSQTTASASEMVINGLRGLDIEVNLIGQTTNGKNVGMEGVMRSFYNHEFLLYPVTFYVENAKGFRDYSTGFVPDVEIDDSAIYPGEFGTMEDQLGYIALVWIKSGKKPELQASSLTRGGGSPMKPFGDLWDIRPIRPMGGAVMRPRTDE